MISHEQLDAFVAEIDELVTVECVPLLDKIGSLCRQYGRQHNEIRLMALPMLYSVWERVFSISTAICLRIVRDSYPKAADCPSAVRALWLRKAGFYKGFVDSVRDILELDREDSVLERTRKLNTKINKGSYKLSSKMLEELDSWHSRPLDRSVNLSDILMTYSNVNDGVVALNAEIIGLKEVGAYESVDLGRLGSLVARRNGIGHGAILDAPGERELLELLDYTKDVVINYSLTVKEWINERKVSPLYERS